VSVDCRILGSDERDRWNDFVRAAPQGTPFHLYEALELFADASNTTAHPLVVRRDGEPIGLFPLFERTVGPVPVAFSPPPSLKVEYMGPVCLDSGDGTAGRRKRDHWTLLDTSMDWLDDHVGPQYVNVRTGPRFDDPRPFVWRDWSLTPRHTYVVDIDTDSDDLFMSFSSDARSNVRDARDRDVDIYEGEHEAIEQTLDLIRHRHAVQGIDFPLSTETVQALYEVLPDGVVRPYVCELSGTFVGGRLTLELEDAAYTWSGTAKRDVPIDANDVLEWHAMQAAMDRGVERYDLVGANIQQTTEYKAKYAPDLERYYTLQLASTPMRAAARVYAELS